MNLILVTDNRFWRRQIGSQQRIDRLYRHFVRQGWVIRTLFIGRLAEHDRIPIASYSHPIVLTPTAGPESGDHERNRGTRLRQWLKAPARYLRNYLRASWRARGKIAKTPRAFVRELQLRAREPKLGDFVSGRSVDLLTRMCDEQTPDCILVEYARLSCILDGARGARARGALALVDTHEVMHHRMEMFHARDEAYYIEIGEEEATLALSRFDAVLAIQATDAMRFRKMLPSVPVLVVGHPSDIQAFQGRASSSVALAFFGSDMSPNRVSLEDFIGSVWREL